jgi:hypothetical protein
MAALVADHTAHIPTAQQRTVARTALYNSIRGHFHVVQGGGAGVAANQQATTDFAACCEILGGLLPSGDAAHRSMRAPPAGAPEQIQIAAGAAYAAYQNNLHAAGVVGSVSLNSLMWPLVAGVYDPTWHPSTEW